MRIHIHQAIFLFLALRIVGTLVMDTLNFPMLTLGIPIWYLNRANPLSTPQDVLTHVQLVGTYHALSPRVTKDAKNSTLNPRMGENQECFYSIFLRNKHYNPLYKTSQISYTICHLLYTLSHHPIV